MVIKADGTLDYLISTVEEIRPRCVLSVLSICGPVLMRRCRLWSHQILNDFVVGNYLRYRPKITRLSCWV
jgi:hypothetical protein